MTSPERIVLPRSGLVLRLLGRDVVFGDLYRADIHADAGIRDRRAASSRLPSSAWCGDVDGIGSLDECIEWLDTRVLALRAALLPPGGVVVTDDEATVEKVAQAISGEESRLHWECPVNAEAEWRGRTELERKRYRAVARAVLAALRGEAPK